jgi:hypothetical protein
VHLLNTADNDGLVTDVDLDCVDKVQGPVTCLLSGPMSGDVGPVIPTTNAPEVELPTDRHASHGKAYH